MNCSAPYIDTDGIQNKLSELLVRLKKCLKSPGHRTTKDLKKTEKLDRLTHSAISLESGSFSGSDEDLGINRGREGVNGVMLCGRFCGVVGEKKSSGAAFRVFSSFTSHVFTEVMKSCMSQDRATHDAVIQTSQGG